MKFGTRKKKVLAQALGFWMDDTIGEMQQEILAVGAFDQGQLSAATTRDPVLIEPKRVSCKGHNDAEHASVIEWGRRAKSGAPPPLLPLVGWAARKGIISALPRNISFDGPWAKSWAASGAILRNMKKGKGGTKSNKPLDPVIRDMLIVRLIARKIFERGTVGRHPFSRVIDRRIPTARQELASLVRLATK